MLEGLLEKLLKESIEKMTKNVEDVGTSQEEQ
jgi:hypothetical protein